VIVVFGSINVDFVARVQRLPQAGETLAGRSFSMLPGGKGAARTRPWRPGAAAQT
jgi:ribokinase